MADGGDAQDPIAVVRAHLEAFNARDVEALVDGFATHGEMRGPDGVGARGEAALRGLFSAAFSGPARVRLELVWARDDEGVVRCALDRHITIESQTMTLRGGAEFAVDDAGDLRAVHVHDADA